jgi:hypothetical protein
MTPIIAALNLAFLKILFFALFLIVGGILKKVAESREKAERMKSATKPPVNPTATLPKRDNQFRNEIEAFLEEVGRKRTGREQPQGPVAERRNAPVEPPRARPVSRPEPMKSLPPVVPTATSVRAKPAPPKAAVPPSPTAPAPQRPGSEIASRKSPVSDDLGAQIRAHLAQYVDSSRMSQRAQADLGNAVERAVRQHLGQTATSGAGDNDERLAAVSASSPIASLLRDSTSVRQAMVINEILGRPKGLQRKA